MARASYGREVKKRAWRLLETLLAYANDELESVDERILDSLRPHIQTRWYDEYRLVVRTKIRFLTALTGLQTEQIKEALRRFADFLEILEDNRPTRGGSENWHFTLHLWHPRSNVKANLQEFDAQWERRRSQKSKQVSHKTDNSSTISTEYWQQLCRYTLEAQNHSRLTTNPLTSVDGVTFEFDEVYLPLGLVERKQRNHSGDDVFPTQGSRLYLTEDAETSQTLTPDEFLEEVLSQRKSQHIAILGEPGAGKTTLLQKIASWVLNNTPDLPIWISLADLQGKTLEEYLIQDWLRTAIRKLQVPQETQEAFCTQFNQGRVWLLLDGIDEMAMESSQALKLIANYLKGWVADATIIITCRLNVWDAGKNPLESFATYCNLNFTYGDVRNPDRVGQFIQRWFAQKAELAQSLRRELDQRGRQRIKDAVKNPLRLALMCRTWGMMQGEFPDTKAMLYQQFVEAIYEWKQDYFPTTISQRQQLNKALGELALGAIAQQKTKFRLSHDFICQILGNPDEGMFQLALQLGWLNQVGISPNAGEKVYAFYHPTFQEYFAALAINHWHFFFNHPSFEGGNPSFEGGNPSFEGGNPSFEGGNPSFEGGNPSFEVGNPSFEVGNPSFGGENPSFEGGNPSFGGEDPSFGGGNPSFGGGNPSFGGGNPSFGGGNPSFGRGNPAPTLSYRIFEPQWREVILLWLGRNDIQKIHKEEFISALISFEDGCGSCYSYHAYFLAAEGIAEFADCSLTPKITAQLIKWRFGYFHEQKQQWWRYPPPILEGARVALLKTDRSSAIAALEDFIQSCKNEFEAWNAAYSLGKTFDPGNSIAIAVLQDMVNSIRHESLRWQAADSLGKIDIGNKVAIQTLLKLIQSSKKDSICRKAAYSLGKIAPGHPIAISTLEKIITTNTNNTVKLQAGANLLAICPENAIALAVKPIPDKHVDKSSRKRKKNFGNRDKLITALVQGITDSQDEESKRRRARRLGKLDPGNAIAFNTILHLVKSGSSPSLRKRAADDFKKILVEEQIPQLIASLKDCFGDRVREEEMERFRECYKLLWYCTEKIHYLEFYQMWQGDKLLSIQTTPLPLEDYRIE
ncbi:MAG: HEAT repeat domain-containing protein [Nostocaceae cyanobacterium]|nr:HEAT repeat domain-containing protein [Nostocaceae cyanobacterium]